MESSLPVVVCGSVNMDIIAHVPVLPRPGETILGHRIQYLPGGKGANQAIAARRLGARVRLWAKVGRDHFGEQLIRFLQSEGLDALKSARNPTGTALIAVEKDGENAILVIPGANFDLSPLEVESLALKEQTPIGLAQMEVPLPTVEAFLRRIKNKQGVTICNPAPAQNCSLEVMRNSDYWVVNETELEFFARDFSLEEITWASETVVGGLPAGFQHRYHALIHQGFAWVHRWPFHTLLITLGSQGVLALGARLAQPLWVRGIAVPTVVDTTGAGDCFLGAFTAALSWHWALPRALEFANKAASLSVQKEGASPSYPSKI